MKPIYLRFSLIAVCSLISLNLLAQPDWEYSYDVGRVKALKENKLLVLDFYADWCGPCRQMDKEVWADDSVVQASRNAILVKIDIDQEPGLKQQYRVNAIPRTVVINFKEEVLWSEVGYQSVSDMLELLQNIPANTAQYNQSLLQLSDTAGFPALMAAAQGSQQLAIETSVLRQELLQKSDDYLEQAIKIVEDKSPAQAQSALLLQYRSLLLNERYKKAVRSLERMQEEISAENEQLYWTLLLLAYRGAGDSQNAIQCSAKLTSLQER